MPNCKHEIDDRKTQVCPELFGRGPGRFIYLVFTCEKCGKMGAHMAEVKLADVDWTVEEEEAANTK